MVKNRGFKPQGIANPLLLARRNVTPQGPTVKDRLERDRPSWQQLKAAAHKKESEAADILEKWESENYRNELQMLRDSRREAQEKEYFLELMSQRRAEKDRLGQSSRHHQQKEGDHPGEASHPINIHSKHAASPSRERERRWAYNVKSPERRPHRLERTRDDVTSSKEQLRGDRYDMRSTYEAGYRQTTRKSERFASEYRRGSSNQSGASHHSKEVRDIYRYEKSRRRQRPRRPSLKSQSRSRSPMAVGNPHKLSDFMRQMKNANNG